MTRPAPLGAMLVLALLAGAGIGHALSLRSSASVAFLGDVLPGGTASYSQAMGTRLHLENAGSDKIRVDLKAVAPPLEGLTDGFDAWPSPGRVRLEATRAALRPGETAEVEIAVPVPKDKAPLGNQYQFDVLATGSDRAGASLALRTRVLLSIGAPLAMAGDIPDEAQAERPGFSLAPEHAALDDVALGHDGSGPGEWTTVKIVNAGDEDLTVTLSPARSWDEGAKLKDGDVPVPNPRWMRLSPEVVKVRAGAIGAARIRVSVPRERRYAARRWAFVAAVDAAAGGKRTRRYFVLRVGTRPWEEGIRRR